MTQSVDVQRATLINNTLVELRIYVSLSHKPFGDMLGLGSEISSVESVILTIILRYKIDLRTAV